MSDTPRTDSCYQQILDEGLGLEYAEDELREWSKKLERELAEAMKDAERYRWLRDGKSAKDRATDKDRKLVLQQLNGAK